MERLVLELLHLNDLNKYRSLTRAADFDEFSVVAVFKSSCLASKLKCAPHCGSTIAIFTI